MPTKSKAKDNHAKPAIKRTGIKPITGKKAGPTADELKKAAEKKTAAAAAEAAAKVPKKVKAATVSLIDDAGNLKVAPRVAAKGAAIKRIVPFLKREPEPEPEPIAPAPVVVLPAGAIAEVAPNGDKLLHVKPPIMVKDLATAMGLKPFVLIKDLMDMGTFANQNQNVDAEIVQKICDKHGWKFEKERREKGGGVHKEEKKAAPAPVKKEVAAVATKPGDPTDVLIHRAPIIVFMGHVDHGKTTLMDTIRKTRVAHGEAGGITQHIGAYSVVHKTKDGKSHPITFLDTPGHAAFTSMRARGANVTDIAVLVVDASDGIMPQTLEALAHAKAAKVKIIVAITKIDMASANVDRVKGQLQEKGLTPEDWGGETIVCPVSALKGQGIDELLEMILLETEMLELKVSHKVAARATVIEAQVEQGRGPTATVIVRMGTLKIGSPFICGDYSGKVKGLVDDRGKNMKEAGPAMPAKVIGFAGMPNAGDELIVMEDERSAQRLSVERLEAKRLGKLTQPKRATLESLFDTIAEGKKPTLTLIIKGDVQGSMEAIINSLGQIKTNKVELNIVHSAVGAISESDVLLGAASDAIVVGFNTKTENNAAIAAKREGVQIKLFSIIYELIDQMKEAMAGLLEPLSREQIIGHAQVKQVFDLTKGVVAGCTVMDGRIQRTGRARLLRNRQPIYDGGLATLRRFQDDVKEVRSGLECGIKLGDYTDYEVGDIIECYLLEKVPQTL